MQIESMTEKRIAFILFGHDATTIALAKHFTDRGCRVDVYVECFRSSLGYCEATDIQQEKLKGVMGKIVCPDSTVMRDYCPKVNFYYVRLVSPMVNHPFLGKVSNMINSVIERYICRKINKEKYGCVILVGRHNADHFIYYHKYLRTKVLTCLHEICNHQNPDFKNASPLLQYLFKNNKQIIVHSNNVLADALKYREASERNVHKLNLGPTETWAYLQDLPSASAILPTGFESDFVLQIGGIDRYKGLDTLLATIKSINQRNGNTIKFVIAGYGSDPYLPELQSLGNVHVINKFLSQTEFALLVRLCRCIICPYHCMSQSGVPLAALVLKKPLIVSKLYGFEEVVKHGENGIMCPSSDVNAFADAITTMFDDTKYSRLRSNISQYEENHPEVSWGEIVKTYFALINS